MGTSRLNPKRVKQHRSYSVDELARCLGVHKNTIHHWRQKGLEPIDRVRPILFQGSAVRDYLTIRNSSRKCPCPPGTFYCVRCRAPRAPALLMVDFLPASFGNGNLRALCECCEAVMHRRVREAEITKVMPNCTIQFGQGYPRLCRLIIPSLNCEFERQG